MNNGHPGVEKVRASIADTRDRVTAHPLYTALDTVDTIAIFAAHHAFAVWDFMSLLKQLQRELTCVLVPWSPRGSAATRRLINDIVTVEESDEIDGEAISHVELYHRAMGAMGADTGPFDRFLGLVSQGEPPVPALSAAGAPAPAIEFVATTWHIIRDLPVHCQAAAFAFGREDLIPGMFDRVVSATRADERLAVFGTYLRRHIEVDGEQHTPMAMRMLIDLCGDDTEKWEACAEAAELAIGARLRFWDGISAALGAVTSAGGNR
jgi:hypothetical protein